MFESFHVIPQTVGSRPILENCISIDYLSSLSSCFDAIKDKPESNKGNVITIAQNSYNESTSFHPCWQSQMKP